jgi:hypothetical protein
MAGVTGMHHHEWLMNDLNKAKIEKNLKHIKI